MKRYHLFPVSILVGSAIVAGCGHLPSFSGPGAAAAPRVSSRQRTGALRVRTQVVPYRVIQDVAGGGYGIADVQTVTLTVSDASGSVLDTDALGSSDLSDTVTFSSLPLEVVTILAQASDAEGNPISVDADSTTTVDVAPDSTSVVSLVVQLADKTQPTMDETFDGIDVLPGNLLSPGPVTISTSSPPVSPAGSGSAATTGASAS